MKSEDVDEMLRNAKEQIYNHLKETSVKLQLDLEHLKYKGRRKYSLTEIVKRKDSFNPEYIIQSWLCDKNTLELLCFLESEHNPNFNLKGTTKLIHKSKNHLFH